MQNSLAGWKGKKENKMTHEEFNFGEEVACDFCNYGEDTMGGLLIGSYAICGDCAKKITHPEEVDRVFNPEKTFRQNVLEYRKEVYGTSDCIMTFTTW